MSRPSRRSFLGHATAAAGVLATSPWTWGAPASSTAAGRPVFGLVTYMWGAQWDLPTLLSNCAKAGAPGVELRTTHAHGVERTMSETQRSEARKRIADSGVTMVGIGSNENFDSPDPAKLKQSIEATKDFIRLSHD
ncbi:MAG: sugar phosphate isomerase/epimerase family protein, partial [Pirellulaceae bacterium]